MMAKATISDVEPHLRVERGQNAASSMSMALTQTAMMIV
jgi:hypothetical protein